MGLDIDIYRENRKGKRNHITYFGNNGWPIVTYFENIHNKEFSDTEVKASELDIRGLIERCRDVIIAYLQNTFEWDKDKWISVAQSLLPISDNSEKDWYDETYIENLFNIYEELMSIYKEMDENKESIIFEISY